MKNTGTPYRMALFSFIDHSANDSGPAGPYNVIAVGIIAEETEHGYYVKHWVFEGDTNDDANVSGYIAKTAGLSMKVLGHVLLR